jgi:hypothetical protein
VINFFKKLIIVLILLATAGIFFIRSPLVFSLPYQEAPQVSPEKLREHVAALTSLRPHRFFASKESLQKAAGYIQTQWESMGLKVEVQKFKYFDEEYSNIVARLGPATERKIVVGAHYDVCMDQPGADDNASGVAALIELARLLISEQGKFKEQIEIVAYSLEEPPYYDTEFMGSFVHANELVKRKEKVSLMLSLEMVGYFSDLPKSQTFPSPMLEYIYPTTGNFISLIGHTGDWALARKLKDGFISASRLPIHSMNAPRFITGIDYSDHRSYWPHGFPALMITDTSFYRNKNYHLKTDTIETLDFGRMAEVVKGTFGILRNQNFRASPGE